MERWEISPELNVAVAHLAATDPAFAAHGRAEQCVDALARLFAVPARIHWARQGGKANLPAPSGAAAFVHESVPGVLVVRVDVADPLVAAVHEYGHELVARGALRRVTRPSKAELGRCDATARLFEDDARRFDRQGFGPEAIALGLYARWAA